MKRKQLWCALLAFILILGSIPAMAADTFRFADREITLFEGETARPELIREGLPAEEGTMTFSSGNDRIATVSSDGTITAQRRGATNISVRLKNGTKNWRTSIKVTVLRRVTGLALDTSRLEMCMSNDPRVSGLLASMRPEKTEEPEESAEESEGPAEEPAEEEEEQPYPVLLFSAGTPVTLKATVTPADASSKKVIYTSSDETVLQVKGGSVRGLQAGLCELTVSSEQNPEVFEKYQVIVVQPVTQITVLADQKAVFVGEQVQLSVICSPTTATVQEVSWQSKSDKIAVVDENGRVTGLRRGSAVIVATALDGSKKTGSITLRVEEKPASVTIREKDLNLVNGQSVVLHATVLPNTAETRTVQWISSDESVAVVNQQGRVTAMGQGECVITAESSVNPEAYASVKVRVVQRVTSITFAESKASIPVGADYQLIWNVYPADATNPSVTFTSSNRRVATVDASGRIIGIARGTATITASATDGSGQKAQFRIQVTQPVEGVSIQYRVYHIQLERYLNVKALIQPSNADNLAVDWSIEDERVASVTGNGRNIGKVRGLRKGITTLTAITRDGGYTATAEIRVDDFNRAAVVDDLYIENEKIRMTFRNRSDFVLNQVNFTVECYNNDGEPIVCNKDGESTFFTGIYPLPLEPGEQTMHYEFEFRNYAEPTEPIGIVVVSITGWVDSEGYTRNIAEDDQPTQTFRRYVYMDEMEPVDDFGTLGAATGPEDSKWRILW